MSLAPERGRWEGNYLTIHRYMVRDLRLKGAPLMAFAVIHGFAQSTGSCTSPLSYFRFWQGCSKPTAIAAIRELVDARLVTKGRARREEAASGRVYRLGPASLPSAAPSAPCAADGTSREASVSLFGWMVSLLGLHGTDLIVYGIVHEACQLGGEARIPLSYLSEFTGASASTARRAVRRLQGRGLVSVRTVADARGVPCNLYSLGPEAVTQSNLVGAGIERAMGRSPEPSPSGGRFSELRSHVPNTDFFSYGRAAYEGLLSDGMTHEEIVAACDDLSRRLKAEYPDRERRYLPRCQRFLESIREERSRARRGRAPREPLARSLSESDLLRVALSRDGTGPVGGEALRLLEASQRARGRLTAKESRAELSAFLEAHRADIEAMSSQGR